MKVKVFDKVTLDSESSSIAEIDEWIRWIERKIVNADKDRTKEPQGSDRRKRIEDFVRHTNRLMNDVKRLRGMVKHSLPPKDTPLSDYFMEVCMERMDSKTFNVAKKEALKRKQDDLAKWGESSERKIQ